MVVGDSLIYDQRKKVEVTHELEIGYRCVMYMAESCPGLGHSLVFHMCGVLLSPDNTPSGGWDVRFTDKDTKVD